MPRSGCSALYYEVAPNKKRTVIFLLKHKMHLNLLSTTFSNLQI